MQADRTKIIHFVVWAARLPVGELTVKTICERWQVSRATAYRWHLDYLHARRAMAA